MHATKLDLRIWIAAIFLVLTSSKGISSVVMARILGVNQKTAWKLGHAIRELMDDRAAVSARLNGVVEVDEAYVGGARKFKKGVKNKRGRGTGKPMVLVAADRTGQAKATLIPNVQGATLGPIMKEWIDPSSALMTDSNTAFRKIGRNFVSHHTVNHGKRQYSRTSKGAHINTVEAVNSQVQRALIGVYHRLGRQPLQRYLDEILWRWNHRQQEVKIRNRKTASGTKAIATTVWKLIPVVEQMRGLLCCAVGRQVRRTPQWGLRWPKSAGNLCENFYDLTRASRLRSLLEKLGIWTASTALIAVMTFVLGIFAGMSIEHINTEIDHCFDETSGRFVADTAARSIICPKDSR